MQACRAAPVPQRFAILAVGKHTSVGTATRHQITTQQILEWEEFASVNVLDELDRFTGGPPFIILSRRPCGMSKNGSYRKQSRVSRRWGLPWAAHAAWCGRSEEHTSELQSLAYLVC